MNPTIIAALIAGAVSIIGLFAGLKMARRAKDATLASLAITQALKMSEQRIDNLRGFAIEIEHFRVLAWNLLDALGVEKRSFQPEVIALEEAWVKLFFSWASVKPDVPNHLIAELRKIRHRLRMPYAGILKSNESIKKVLESPEINPAGHERVDKWIELMRRDLRLALHISDEFFLFVLSAKEDVFNEIMAIIGPAATREADYFEDSVSGRGLVQKS